MHPKQMQLVAEFVCWAWDEDLCRLRILDLGELLYPHQHALDHVKCVQGRVQSLKGC